jgi:hypothetical protein
MASHRAIPQEALCFDPSSNSELKSYMTGQNMNVPSLPFILLKFKKDLLSTAKANLSGNDSSSDNVVSSTQKEKDSLGPTMDKEEEALKVRVHHAGDFFNREGRAISDFHFEDFDVSFALPEYRQHLVANHHATAKYAAAVVAA